MAVRASFENNNEIGCFAKLTNAYCLVAVGGSEGFYRYAEKGAALNLASLSLLSLARSLIWDRPTALLGRLSLALASSSSTAPFLGCSSAQRLRLAMAGPVMDAKGRLATRKRPVRRRR